MHNRTTSNSLQPLLHRQSTRSSADWSRRDAARNTEDRLRCVLDLERGQTRDAWTCHCSDLDPPMLFCSKHGQPCVWTNESSSQPRHLSVTWKNLPSWSDCAQFGGCLFGPPSAVKMTSFSLVCLDKERRDEVVLKWEVFEQVNTARFRRCHESSSPHRHVAGRPWRNLGVQHPMVTAFTAGAPDVNAVTIGCCTPKFRW